MQHIVFFLYFLLSTIISIHIVYQLMGVKENFKKILLISISIVTIYYSISVLLEPAWVIDVNIYISIVVIIMAIYSSASRFQLIITIVITNTTIFMIKDMFIKVFVIVNNISISTLYYNISTLILEETMSIIVYLIILVLIKYYKLSLFEGDVLYNTNILRNNSKNNIINIYNIIIIVVVAQMWVLTMYFQINDAIITKFYTEGNPIHQGFFTLIFSFFIIIVNIIVLFMLKKILILAKQQYQYKIKEKEFTQIKQQDKINRQYKHDLSNHFKLLKVLAEEKKYEELNNYLKYYNEELNSDLINVDTGSVELDILLNSKINYAQAHKIVVKYNCIADIECINRHIINLISIVGNVLDNAIEASEKSEKKCINIEIDEDTLDYIFIIKNTTNNDKLVTSDTLVKENYSTKGHGRGTGLSVVNRLVKKYGGSINISNENKIFVIRINLPIHELRSM